MSGCCHFVGATLKTRWPKVAEPDWCPVATDRAVGSEERKRSGKGAAAATWPPALRFICCNNQQSTINDQQSTIGRNGTGRAGVWPPGRHPFSGGFAFRFGRRTRVSSRCGFVLSMVCCCCIIDARTRRRANATARAVRLQRHCLLPLSFA